MSMHVSMMHVRFNCILFSRIFGNVIMSYVSIKLHKPKYIIIMYMYVHVPVKQLY